MSSERQIAANRLNARKSSGPRTTAGKSIVCRNALRHGLTATVHRIRCRRPISRNWQRHFAEATTTPRCWRKQG
jgi:hypothetical protein